MKIYDDEDSIAFIKDPTSKYQVDLRERLLNFSVDIIKMLKSMSTAKENDVIKYQLTKSATSIGANYEEAQSSSYKEFVQKTRIALREANESKYWLKIINKLDLVKVDRLIKEVDALSKILGSIVSKADKKLKS
jgi:four helix bundle protein